MPLPCHFSGVSRGLPPAVVFGHAALPLRLQTTARVRLRPATAPGFFQARWSIGSGARRRYRSEVVPGTQAEAVLRTRLAERERTRGLSGLAADPHLTVEQWLRHWLAHVAAERIRPATLYGYRNIVETQLIPNLGHRRLTRLSVADLQTYFHTLADRPAWRRYVRAVLRSALAEAERQELVSRNVARLVRLQTPPRKEVRPLTPEQTQTLLQEIAGDRLEALFQLAIATGMRQGELLGLTWPDVDLEAGTLTVRRSLKRYDGAYHLDDIKTDRSRRTLALAPPLVAALRRHRRAQIVRFSWRLVFVTRNGQPLNGTNVTHTLQRHLKRAGLPRIRFHDLRHGAATYLLGAGVGMKEVSDLLGHQQMSTTADIYAHMLPEARRVAMDKLADVVFS